LTVHPYFFAARTFAHLALWAAAILFLPAADILRRGAVACFVAFVPSSNLTTWFNLCISSFTSRIMFSIMLAPSVRSCDGEG
jgi:hypothetical protein